MSFFSLRSGHDWPYFGVFGAHLDGNWRSWSLGKSSTVSIASSKKMEWVVDLGACYRYCRAGNSLGMRKYLTSWGVTYYQVTQKWGIVLCRQMRKLLVSKPGLWGMHAVMTSERLIHWCLCNRTIPPHNLSRGAKALTTRQCLRSESMHHHDLMTSQVDSRWENLISTSPIPVVHSVPPSMGSAPSSFPGGARIP